MPITLDAWADELSEALGVDRGAYDQNLLLDLARDAAHGVSRPSAPLTTFMVGLAAGRSGGDLAAVRAAAQIATRLANAHAQERGDSGEDDSPHAQHRRHDHT